MEENLTNQDPHDPEAETQSDGKERSMAEKMREIKKPRRLRELALAHANTLGEFAVMVGMSESNFSQYIRGERKLEGSKLALRLIQSGFNVDWILTGRGSRYADNEIGKRLQDTHNRVIQYASNNVSTVDKLRREINSEHLFSAQPLPIEKTNIGSPISSIDSKGIIRVYMTPANAGRGFALEDMPDAQDARPLFMNNDDVIVVPVSGNSMEPVIMDGDKVYVDVSRKEPRLGEIVLCNVDGVNYVKYYVKKEDGKIYLASLNKAYAPIRINGFNNSRVYGVVVQISRTPERANVQDFVIEE